MPFLVIAQSNHDWASECRNQAASAAVVAMRFVERGYTDVMILDGEGYWLTIEELRARHLPSGSKVKMRPARSFGIGQSTPPRRRPRLSLRLT